MWKCAVDDPKFNDINASQWRWYAHMFSIDEELEFKKNLELVEYLASFWNSEAVNNIKKNREKKNNTTIDENIIKENTSDKYKENPLIKALQKIRENANLTNTDIDANNSSEIKRTKAPIDLDKLAKISRI